MPLLLLLIALVVSNASAGRQQQLQTQRQLRQVPSTFSGCVTEKCQVSLDKCGNDAVCQTTLACFTKCTSGRMTQTTWYGVKACQNGCIVAGAARSYTRNVTREILKCAVNKGCFESSTMASCPAYVAWTPPASQRAMLPAQLQGSYCVVKAANPSFIDCVANQTFHFGPPTSGGHIPTNISVLLRDSSTSLAIGASTNGGPAVNREVLHLRANLYPKRLTDADLYVDLKPFGVTMSRMWLLDSHDGSSKQPEARVPGFTVAAGNYVLVLFCQAQQRVGPGGVSGYVLGRWRTRACQQALHMDLPNDVQEQFSKALNSSGISGVVLGGNTTLGPLSSWCTVLGQEQVSATEVSPPPPDAPLQAAYQA